MSSHTFGSAFSLMATAAVACGTLLLPLAAALVLVIAIGVGARRRMRRVFSGFWHGVVGPLR